jgi:hypothetical protein
MRRQERLAIAIAIVLLGAAVSVPLAAAQTTSTTTTAPPTTTTRLIPFFDNLTIVKHVVGTPLTPGTTFTVAVWCLPGVGPGGVQLPTSVTFDELGNPIPSGSNSPGWLKGGPARCLLAESPTRDPSTGTPLRGDSGGATTVSFSCRISPSLDHPDRPPASCGYVSPDVFSVQFTGAGNNVGVEVVNTFAVVTVAPSLTG